MSVIIVRQADSIRLARTTDPARRLRELSQGSAPTELLLTVDLNEAAERHLHLCLQRHKTTCRKSRVASGWYRLPRVRTTDDARQLVADAAAARDWAAMRGVGRRWAEVQS